MCRLVGVLMCVVVLIVSVVLCIFMLRFLCGMFGRLVCSVMLC